MQTHPHAHKTPCTPTHTLLLTPSLTPSLTHTLNLLIDTLAVAAAYCGAQALHPGGDGIHKQREHVMHGSAPLLLESSGPLSCLVLTLFAESCQTHTHCFVLFFWLFLAFVLVSVVAQRLYDVLFAFRGCFSVVFVCYWRIC